MKITEHRRCRKTEPVAHSVSLLLVAVLDEISGRKCIDLMEAGCALYVLSLSGVIQPR